MLFFIEFWSQSVNHDFSNNIIVTNCVQVQEMGFLYTNVVTVSKNKLI